MKNPKKTDVERLPPAIDTRTFMMRLYQLSKDAHNIKWSTPIEAINALALVDILREHMIEK